jgi:hypothetical protein
MAGGVVAGAGLAALAFLAGCQLVLDFSPITDIGSEVDAAPLDGSTPDAADLCALFEPNDDLTTAAMVDPGTFQASICEGGDSDFYGFALDGTQDLIVDLTFVAGPNDLELELYNADTTEVLVLSTGGDGDEKIERSAAQSNRLVGGSYAIRVFGRDGAAVNDYQVTWVRGQ